ncbi:MAG: hypothetical protein CMI67_17870 [Pelagibaca sp.]|nr:hypothetical protein [Pelagibaca sp.]|tara:strand:+ start:678 stop:893 length:216 start_codon:yes stop_codon:yes gene_type:complete
MGKIKAVITLLLVFAVALFAIQNAEVVEINFLAWSFSIPRVLLVVALLAAGFVLGIIVSSISALKTRTSDS